jgi:hypothetical protein
MHIGAVRRGRYLVMHVCGITPVIAGIGGRTVACG